MRYSMRLNEGYACAWKWGIIVLGDRTGETFNFLNSGKFVMKLDVSKIYAQNRILQKNIKIFD